MPALTASLHAKRAFLHEGWAEDVLFRIGTDGRIASVEIGAAPGDAERAAGPVVPAMPNLHSHAFQRAMAGLAEIAGSGDDSFWTWRDRMYRTVERLTLEDVEAIAARLYVEMIKAGYGAVAEFHYLHHDSDGGAYADPGEMAGRILAAADRAGIGLTLLPVFYAHAGFGGTAPAPGQRRFIHGVDAYLKLLEGLRAILPGGHRNLGLAFHSLRAVTPEEMTAILAAKPVTGPLHIHIAEQQKEVDDCLAWAGQRPIAWLLDHMPVDRRWCLVHATHADDDETRRLAASGAVAGLCPTTEANLGDGLFPATSYIAQGGRWGIGSDSHVSLSVVEELRWLEYGQRLRDERRIRMAAGAGNSVGRALFDASLAGGAQALGQPIGRLAAGSLASLVVLDGAEPAIETAAGDAILDRWLFGLGDRAERDVMVAGRWQVRDGRHPLEEETAVAYRRALGRLYA
jgi:formimidoylglutamate deiminase